MTQTMQSTEVTTGINNVALNLQTQLAVLQKKYDMLNNTTKCISVSTTQLTQLNIQIREEYECMVETNNQLRLSLENDYVLKTSVDQNNNGNENIQKMKQLEAENIKLHVSNEELLATNMTLVAEYNESILNLQKVTLSKQTKPVLKTSLFEHNNNNNNNNNNKLLETIHGLQNDLIALKEKNSILEKMNQSILKDKQHLIDKFCMFKTNEYTPLREELDELKNKLNTQETKFNTQVSKLRTSLQDILDQ